MIKGLTRAGLVLLIVGLAASYACSGEKDHSLVQTADVGALLATLPSLNGAKPSGELIIAKKSELAQPIRDAGFDKHWKGQYLGQFQNLVPDAIFFVSVDVYKQEPAARARADGEPAVLQRLFASLSDAEFVDVTSPKLVSGCAGKAVKETAVHSQYVMYCQVDTALIAVQVTGGDETKTVDLAASIASELQASMAAIVAAATPTK